MQQQFVGQPVEAPALPVVVKPLRTVCGAFSATCGLCGATFYGETNISAAYTHMRVVHGMGMEEQA